MWRTPIHLILFSGLLCASGFARNKDVSADNQFLPSCINSRSTLVDIVTWHRDGKHSNAVPIWRLPHSDTFFFISGMTIDADGAPNAYHPEDTGLDELANAGSTAHWDGIITDRYGIPLIQADNDPFPGYYISCTSLEDETKEFTDPTRYVDATKIPYIALPEDVANAGGVRLGDFAFVMDLRTGKSSFAIYADIGTIGEGSVALANRLGISADARSGGQPDGIVYILFAGSGNQQPRTLTEIQSEGQKLLFRSVSLKELSSCLEVHGGVIGSGEL